MTFLHWTFRGKAGDTVSVALDTPAYVRLLDPLNFEYYRKGNPFSGLGGWSDALEVQFAFPYQGTFHVVIDLGGNAGTVRATCEIARM